MTQHQCPPAWASARYQRRGDPLEAVHARTFHVNRETGVELVLQRPDQVVRACIPGRARPERLHGGPRAGAHGEQTRHAALAGQGTHLGVQLRAFRAELGHLAQHQPALTRNLRQRAQADAQRAGIGVVGVVDEPRTAQRLLHFESTGHGPHRREAALHGVQARAGGQRRRRRGERIHDVVLAGERELDAALPRQAWPGRTSW